LSLSVRPSVRLSLVHSMLESRPRLLTNFFWNAFQWLTFPCRFTVWLLSIIIKHDCVRKRKKITSLPRALCSKRLFFLDVMNPSPPSLFILLSPLSPHPPLNLSFVLCQDSYLLACATNESHQRLHSSIRHHLPPLNSPSLPSFIILFAHHPPWSSCPSSPFSRVFYTIYFLKSFVQNWFYSIFFVALTKKAFLCLHARSLVEYRAVRHLHRQQQQQPRRQLYYDRLISPWWSVTQRSASKCLFIIEHIYDLQSSQVLFIYVYEKGDNDE